MTRWLIDGMNVIGSRPDGWWRDRTGAMTRLVSRLDLLAEGVGEEVTVVFDGRPRELGAHAVSALFADRAGRDAADDVIAARAAADPDPSTLWVVTSDAGLAGRVRGAGAEVVGAGSFLRRLDELGL